jgi:mannose-6-phosphate isomerase-like protein (cupin superfamily)
MTRANWKTQVYSVIQSLLFDNPHHVIHYRVQDEQGEWHERTERPAPVRRLFETAAPPERTCLQTAQFVHHMLIPPGGRHVQELHIHPDAEEIVVITRGVGQASVGGRSFPVAAEDVVYIPPGAEHELRNTGDDLLGVLFINVPTGEALRQLLAAQASAAARDPS